MTSIRITPRPDKFYREFFLITEGRYLENSKTRIIDFCHYISALTSSDEHRIVQFINHSIKQLQELMNHQHGSGPKPRGVCFFNNFEGLFTFFAGIVHYCPTILLHQLKEQSRIQRLNAVELILSITLYLCDRNYRYSFAGIFFTKTKDSSPYHFLVFEEYMKRATDVNVEIRACFLKWAAYMLACEVKSDWNVRQMAGTKMADRMRYDSKFFIRIKALSALNELFTRTVNPINAFNDQLLDTLTQSCFDDDQRIRYLAQVCSTKGYIRLMKQYPAYAFVVSKVGRLAGALKRKFSQSMAGPEKDHLVKLLVIIKEFLQDQESGCDLPAEHYFSNPILREEE